MLRNAAGIICFIAVLGGSQARAQFVYDMTSTTRTGSIPEVNAGGLSSINGGNSAGLDGAQPSLGYAGASGGNNFQLAAAGGALNVSTSTYLSFTLTPNSGFGISLTGISFGARSSNTGPTTLSVRTSLDNFAADLVTFSGVPTSSAWALYSSSLTTATSGAPLTVRVYGSGGQAASTGNLRLDDLSISAASVAIPEPATALLIGLALAPLALLHRRKK